MNSYFSSVFTQQQSNLAELGNIIFTSSEVGSKHPHHLSNTELESVNSCKDLGAHLSRDLSWSNHVDAIVTKASRWWAY